MMKKIFFLLSVLNLWYFIPVVAQQKPNAPYKSVLQQRGEVYFSFSVPKSVNSRKLISRLGQFISIDHKEGSRVFAYAGGDGFDQFLSYKLDYRLCRAPSMLLSPDILNPAKRKSSLAWNYYPSYDEYVQLMHDFQSQHPGLCELKSIGKSVLGRDLLFIHFMPSDSLISKPQIMYTATMHGDETTPYVLMLHLIDYLLNDYDSNSRIRRLLDSLDIWINPLANPDGTYAGGNNSVYGATRFNANGVDLNRNYPDPDMEDHPDNHEWQPETKAFMDFAKVHHFVLSCNMHTGSEVANYPWDIWSRRHADDAWWQNVCRQYADTVHKYTTIPNYFTDLNNGITDGYDWYSVNGGRQDYMNYFEHSREFTLEMSATKMPDPSSLPEYWESNYRSFIDYMEQAGYGLWGRVYDSLTGEALAAKIFLVNHDTDHSEVYSALPRGYFYRPLAAGMYRLRVSCKAYQSKIFDSINVAPNQKTFLSVALKPMSLDVQNSEDKAIKIYPNPAATSFYIVFRTKSDSWEIVNILGQRFRSGQKLPSQINVAKWPRGTYFFNLLSNKKRYSRIIQLQ